MMLRTGKRKGINQGTSRVSRLGDISAPDLAHEKCWVAVGESRASRNLTLLSRMLNCPNLSTTLNCPSNLMGQ